MLASIFTVVKTSSISTSTRSNGAPRTVAIGVYLSLRNIADNVVSWRRYIIDPLLDAGSTVHIYIHLDYIRKSDQSNLRSVLRESRLMPCAPYSLLRHDGSKSVLEHDCILEYPESKKRAVSRVRTLQSKSRHVS